MKLFKETEKLVPQGKCGCIYGDGRQCDEDATHVIKVPIPPGELKEVATGKLNTETVYSGLCVCAKHYISESAALGIPLEN